MIRLVLASIILQFLYISTATAYEKEELCDKCAIASEFSWNPDNEYVSERLNRFYQMDKLIEATYEKKEYAKASEYISEYLELANIYRCNWNYGNAIHDGNRILGLMSLDQDDHIKASEYLVKAGKSTGSPQLDTFGPELNLANSLLKVGMSQKVIKYLEGIKGFWRHDKGRIKIWIDEISNGNQPILDRHSYVNVESNMCDEASHFARGNEFKKSIKAANACLGLDDLSLDSKIWAYRSLAWSYSGLSDFANAAKNQKKVIELGSMTYNDLINGGLYLRYNHEFEESLELLLLAKRYDDIEEHTSMMTQYHLGQTYHQLGKYEQAIEEYTLGIPAQPDFSFAYYRRGLAYHALGQIDNAKADFQKFQMLLKPEVIDSESKNELDEKKALLESYNIELNLDI